MIPTQSKSCVRYPYHYPYKYIDSPYIVHTHDWHCLYPYTSPYTTFIRMIHITIHTPYTHHIL
ncbi:hypothetical protein EON63_10565 [archaeon]|nr:MAG: hypothetical protein EON63_10565 [archaeon]